MASIDRVPNPDDPKRPKWRARWRTPDNASRSRTFDRKIDAEQWLASVEHSKLSGVSVDPTAGRVTFGAYAERWLANSIDLRAQTRERIATNLRAHLIPHFGQRPLGAIKLTEVQAFITAKATELAPGTVELIYRQLTTILRAAVRDRVIAANPAEGVKLPREHRGQVQPLPLEHVQAMADAVPPRYRAAVILGAGCGLRQGEMLGLTIDRVDFLRRSVRVDRQLVTQDGQTPRWGPPKTKSSDRTIPAPQVVLDALAEHVHTYGTGRDGLLFPTATGEPMTRNAWLMIWRRAAAKVGLPGGEGYHALRHVYASLLIANGCSVKAVSARLGHSSAAMTLDVYSHLWPDEEERTRSAIDAAFTGAWASPSASSTASGPPVCPA